MDFYREAKEIVEKMSSEQKIRLFMSGGYEQLDFMEELGIPFAMHIAEGMSKLHLSEKFRSGEITGLTSNIEFPAEGSLASCFDEFLLEEIGEALGEQCLEYQIDAVRVWGADIVLNPLKGDSENQYSEDPCLAGKLTAGFINGLQKTGVAACLTQNQDSVCLKQSVSDKIRQDYLMKAYQITLSDSFPLMISSESVSADISEKTVQKELKNSALMEEAIDSGVTGIINSILTIQADKKRRIQFADQSGDFFRLSNRQGFYFNRSRHSKLALKAAEESAVLLKNNGVLPLKQKNNIAIIGALAKYPHDRTADAGFGQNEISGPFRVFTEYGYSFGYADGYSLSDSEDYDGFLEEAVKVSRGRDIVIVFLGQVHGTWQERKNLRIPEKQSRLLDAVLSVNQNVVVVMENSSVFRLPQLPGISALLSMEYAGEQCGRACVNLLSGKSNPGGKTAVTMPLTAMDIPSFEQNSQTLQVGYGYYDREKIDVLFPFGYGLSYTTFEYGNVEADGMEFDLSKENRGIFHIDISVSNTGEYDGKEIVQLYIRKKGDMGKELKAFTKIFIPKKESRLASFELTKEDFMKYSVEKKQFEIENGEYEILIGSNSRNILKSFYIKVFA